MAPIDYIAATGVAEVLDALADGAGSVLAGGQSLVLAVPREESEIRRVVDINRVPGLDVLVEHDGYLRVGPLVRHRTFESDAIGGPLGDLLRAVVRHIGHPPIRARGTMLGSLAFAHPAAEWPVVAMMLGARLVLTGPHGTRMLPAEEFFQGPHTTACRRDELVTEARLPVLPSGTGIGYAEDRRTTIFPEAAAIAAVTVREGLVSSAAIGLVNAGPRPVRAVAAEKTLVGGLLSDAAITAAAEVAAEVDIPVASAPDGAGPARRRALRTLTRRALSQARGRV